MSNYFNDFVQFINSNKLLSSVLGIFIILYATMAAPKLPKSVVQIFDNKYFKLGFMFMIAYLATKNPAVSIITAVALLITIQTLTANESVENFRNKALEKFNPLLPENININISDNNQNQNQNQNQNIDLNLLPNEKVNEVNQQAETIINNKQNETPIKDIVDNIDIQLTPEQLNVIEDRATKADAQLIAADEAQSKDISDAHKEAASKDMVIIESVLSIAELKEAAEKAFKEGNIELSEMLMKEVVKQEIKMRALMDAEKAISDAIDAKNNGDISKATDLIQQADEAENKAKLIVIDEEAQQIINQDNSDDVQRQTDKVDAIIKKEEAIIAIEDAKTNGNLDDIKQNEEKAERQAEIIDILDKVDDINIAIDEAKNNNNTEIISKLEDDVQKLEDKADALIEVDEKKEAAKDALDNGNVEEARQNMEEATKKEEEAEKIEISDIIIPKIKKEHIELELDVINGETPEVPLGFGSDLIGGPALVQPLTTNDLINLVKDIKEGFRNIKTIESFRNSIKNRKSIERFNNVKSSNKSNHRNKLNSLMRTVEKFESLNKGSLREKFESCRNYKKEKFTDDISYCNQPFENGGTMGLDETDKYALV